MSRYRISESVGSHVESVQEYQDLEKHHPSSGRESGRDYATIDGRLEEVRHLSDGRTLVKKDFILSQDSPGPVNVPAPASGYVHYLNDATNAVRIYDRPFGQPGAQLLAQALHMERGTSPPEGSRVQYGQPLGRMGDTGSPGSVHAHVEMEPAAFRRYVHDITSGAITPDRFPARDGNGQTPTPAEPTGPRTLRAGDRGDDVTALQTKLNAQGFRDAQGRALATDGDFGDRTQQAVKAYQRAHGLGDDGIVGRDTRAALAGPATPAPANTPANTPTNTPPTTPAQPQTPATAGTTALSNLIGRGEGGYDSYNRGRAGDSRQPLDISGMTVGEIMRRQALPGGDPDRLFAVGKFQMIPGTMRETVDALGIDRNARFTPALQERMFSDYLIDEKRPAVHAYITGQSSGPDGLRRAQLALSQEFASVADPRTGRSYYDGDSAGNHSSITAAQAATALDRMRTQYQANVDRGLAPDAAYRALSGQTAPTRDGERTAPTPGGNSQSGDRVLREGAEGADVTRLQQRLNALGARDGQGRALGEDGQFGPNTRQALEGFQRAKGLEPDGVAGRDTFAALRAAPTPTRPGETPAPAATTTPTPTPATATREPLLSDPAHPRYALFEQAMAATGRLPQGTFRNEDERRNASATLAFEANVSGLRKIDEVVPSTNGKGLFAVDGALTDPSHHRVYADKAQASAQTVEQSTQLMQQDVQPKVAPAQPEPERRQVMMA